VIDALRAIGDSPIRIPLVEPPADQALALAQLVLLPSDGPVNVAVDGDELRVSGAPSFLGQLAHHLMLYADSNDLDEPGMHTHVDREWHPVPEWLDPATTPLAVGGWVPES
jgi:hypothetical protein